MSELDHRDEPQLTLLFMLQDIIVTGIHCPRWQDESVRVMEQSLHISQVDCTSVEGRLSHQLLADPHKPPWILNMLKVVFYGQIADGHFF